MAYGIGNAPIVLHAKCPDVVENLLRCMTGIVTIDCNMVPSSGVESVIKFTHHLVLTATTNIRIEILSLNAHSAIKIFLSSVA